MFERKRSVLVISCDLERQKSIIGSVIESFKYQFLALKSWLWKKSRAWDAEHIKCCRRLWNNGLRQTAERNANTIAGCAATLVWSKSIWKSESENRDILENNACPPSLPTPNNLVNIIWYSKLSYPGQHLYQMEPLSYLNMTAQSRNSPRFKRELFRDEPRWSITLWQQSTSEQMQKKNSFILPL